MKTKDLIILEEEMFSSFKSRKFAKSKRLANKYLECSQSNKDNWNYGNAIHKANIILGKISLIENQIELAKDYLIKAGNTPGSPQLNSFGPNMSLAKDLLENGEKESVILFIEQSKSYWKWIFSWRKIRRWKKEINKGIIPNFGSNLNY